MPNPAVQPLVRPRPRARRGVQHRLCRAGGGGRCSTPPSWSTPEGAAILGTYRKVHLPGSVEPRPGEHFHQLEKRYFAYGDQRLPRLACAAASLGGGVLGMLICNDRRWPEAWRVLGLQGVELVCCGYNSAAYDPNGGTTENEALRTFHSQLAVQSNAYMNATWAVAVAKAGVEDGAGPDRRLVHRGPERP